MSTNIEKALKVLKVQIEKELRTGLAPQFQDPKMFQGIINELSTQYGVRKNEWIMEILEEFKKVLEGDVDSQIEMVTVALAENITDANLWCQLATMLKKKGRLISAIICFQYTLSLEPEHSDANYNYGNLLRDQGDLEGAEKQYRKCIEIDPKDFNAHNNLGELLIRTHQMAEAEQELKKAIEVFPLHVKAYNNLAVLYVLLQNFDKAESCLRKAIDIDPDYQKAKENLAKLLAFKEKKGK